MATELVGIELRLMGAEGVYQDMKELDAMVRRLGGRHKIELELGKAKQRILELNGEINKTVIAIDKSKAKIRELNAALKSVDEGSDAYEELQEKISDANDELREQREHLGEVRSEMRNTRQEANELSNALGRVKPLKQVFDDISLKVARVGSALQSAGNALTRFSAPVRMLMGGAIMGAGYNILGKATEGLKSGFSRYDTLKKYERLMKEYETANYTAEQSRKDLDASVQGLPIALDDAVSLAQRYTLSLGDMERGTQLAIATNNAFLASMATENQRYQGMLQMQDLLNGKDLNSREWMSLGASMGKAINEVGKEFGYTNENMGEFRDKLYSGKIATNDFLDALQKVGTGEGSLVKLAEQSKDTWEAFTSRIGTAFSRVGYNMLLSMDKLVEAATKGKWKSLNSFLDDQVIPKIDELNEKAVKWIDSNHDRILDFVDTLKSINWKSVLTGFAEGLSQIANSIKRLADIASGMNLSWLGKLFAKSGAQGWFLTVLGGLFKGTRHIWAGIGTAITALTRHFLAGKVGKGGIFGTLASIFGKKKDAETVAETAKSFPTAVQSLRGVVSSLSGFIKVGGGIAIASGSAIAVVKSVKTVLKDLGEIGEIISSGQIDWGSAAKAMGGFAAYLAAFGSAAYVIGDISSTLGTTAGLGALKGEAVVGAFLTFASAIAAADMRLIKDAFKSFRDITDYLGESVTNLNGLKKFKKDRSLERIKNVVDTMGEVYSALKDTDGEGKSLMSASGQELSSMKTIIGGMRSILEDILPINESMTALSKAKLLDKKASQDVGDKISGMLEGLNTAFATFLGGDYGKNPADLSSEMASTIQNFNSALTAMTGNDGLFVNMRKVLNDTRDIPGVQNINSVMSSLVGWMTDDGGFFSKMKDMVKGVNELGDTSSVETKMSNFANAFKSIKTIFKKLSDIKGIVGDTKYGEIPGMSAVRSLIAQLQTEFSAERVGTINSQVEMFVTQINGLLDIVNNINAKDGNITIEIHLKDKIIGKDTVISDIKKAADDIKAAIDGIKTYYRKNVTIDVVGNAKFRQSGDGWTRGSYNGNENGRATGGLIYRAKGGNIPWKRRGTDTVPAMLTPGEYVHNKRAVNTFGIDFMRKVNNLDVKGAMNELMHRAGNMANVNRGTVITNNTYNNQKISITNNGNPSAGYTFKRASRFVGAI